VSVSRVWRQSSSQECVLGLGFGLDDLVSFNVTGLTRLLDVIIITGDRARRGCADWCLIGDAEIAGRWLLLQLRRAATAEVAFIRRMDRLPCF